MPATRVAVCVITYRRPRWLADTLAGLAEQRFAEPLPEVHIIVVENEENGPAADVCHRAAEQCPFPITHRCEPQRGIPFARNTAIATAGGNIDWIAFIDDDEVPEPGWLDELLRVQRVHAADMVAGPVQPRYQPDVPHWMRQAGFHQRRRVPTGSEVFPQGTGNVLFRRAMVDAMPVPFDPRYALTGGSDADFFHRVAAAGHRCVWADDAVVYEWVPRSRATARWICTRAYRSGINYTRLTCSSKPRSQAIRETSLAALKYGVWGILGMPLVIGGGVSRLLWQAKHLSRSCGIIAGLLGARHEEYRTTHGD